jgi:hypothetical protein
VLSKQTRRDEMDEFTFEYGMGENAVEVTFSVEQETDTVNMGGTPDNIATKDVSYNVVGEISDIHSFNKDTGFYDISIFDHIDLNVWGFQEVINGKTVFILFKDDMMAKARELFEKERDDD